MYFGPRVLHMPTELCSRMIIKIHKLGDIGEISPMVPQIGVKLA